MLPIDEGLFRPRRQTSNYKTVSGSKTALADELGLIPSAATRDLYYSLCGDEQDLVTLF